MRARPIRRARPNPYGALLATLFALPLAAGCAPRPGAAPWRDVHEVTPAFLVEGAAADPSLATGPGGRLALTWVSRDSRGADAWIAVTADSGETWSEPVRLNERPGGVSSYPESRPVAAWGERGLLVAAWAAARDTAEYADDIAVRASADGGRTWGPATLVNDDHRDRLSTYHGFVALTVLADGRPFVAWIDGRFSTGAGGEPHVADIFCTTSSDGGATWAANTPIAGEVCPCCRLGVASAGRDTVALAYRGAFDDLRDPRLAVSYDGGRTFAEDTLVSADHWKLAGCPSVGPSLTLEGHGGHYAWFTGESPEDSLIVGRPAPGAYLVPWRMGAGAAGPRRALDDSLAGASFPALARLGRGTIVAARGKAVGGPDRRVLAVRRLEPDGRLTPWLYLGSGVRSAAVAAQGASGAWAVWTEQDEQRTRVRLARLGAR
jgi:hypothetical protein